MDFTHSFKKTLLNNFGFGHFELAALQLFRFQAKNNAVYAEYLEGLKLKPERITSVFEIPFLPIDFFRDRLVSCMPDRVPEIVFESSGTTGQKRSRHNVYDKEFYTKVSEKIFEHFYGALSDYEVLALLPSYLERKNASLVFMAEHFIKKAGKHSGFFLNDTEKLIRTLAELQKKPKKILLLGVTFALLDLAENYKPDLSKVMVMETGGMKGRRKELTREEVHHILKSHTGAGQIYSEYGMTELLSQAYTAGGNIFCTSPTMRVICRNPYDPFEKNRASGGLNIIDLSNADTCAFIETKDLGRLKAFGKYREKHGFSVEGRFDHSELRGCNLMLPN